MIWCCITCTLHVRQMPPSTNPFFNHHSMRIIIYVYNIHVFLGEPSIHTLFILIINQGLLLEAPGWLRVRHPGQVWGELKAFHTCQWPSMIWLVRASWHFHLIPPDVAKSIISTIQFSKCVYFCLNCCLVLSVHFKIKFWYPDICKSV